MSRLNATSEETMTKKLPFEIEGPYRRGDKELPGDFVDDLSSKFGERMATVRAVLAVAAIVSIVGLVSALAGYLTALSKVQ